MQSDIQVPYEEMKFYYILNHYDIHLHGYCWYNDKLAEFTTWDEMETGPICHIAELNWYERIGAVLYCNVYLPLWFMYRWKSDGYGYWKRWKYEH